ncbi:hypothetical protein PIB30_075506 [Stylosanthes scabra]|uniref:Uncharacterized protein n=1 Tax=Stylosanthes scabra TaxID=79078 RepID=A0ABU6TRH0_9FABA|nr:hypothetical protein [Stylosanthes scabra]
MVGAVQPVDVRIPHKFPSHGHAADSTSAAGVYHGTAPQPVPQGQHEAQLFNQCHATAERDTSPAPVTHPSQRHTPFAQCHSPIMRHWLLSFQGSAAPIYHGIGFTVPRPYPTTLLTNSKREKEKHTAQANAQTSRAALNPHHENPLPPHHLRPAIASSSSSHRAATNHHVFFFVRPLKKSNLDRRRFVITASSSSYRKSQISVATIVASSSCVSVWRQWW